MSQAPVQVSPIPQPPVLGYAPARRNNLREIAVRQKAILWCIVAQIAALALMVALGPDLAWVIGLVRIVVSLASLVFVFMLAVSVYKTGVGIVLGLLVLIPLVGLLVLLFINGKATKELRAHGIKVGLMGANLSQVPQTPSY